MAIVDLNYNQPSILPCDFLDSINITDGVMQPDESILFDRIKYANGTYKTINYSYTWENEPKFHQTNAYIRGCIPKSKPFIRLFCPRGLENLNCPSYKAVQNHQQKILDENNEEIMVILSDYFGFLFDAPCKISWIDNYTLFYVK